MGTGISKRKTIITLDRSNESDRYAQHILDVIQGELEVWGKLLEERHSENPKSEKYCNSVTSQLRATNALLKSLVKETENQKLSCRPSDIDDRNEGNSSNESSNNDSSRKRINDTSDVEDRPKTSDESKVLQEGEGDSTEDESGSKEMIHPQEPPETSNTHNSVPGEATIGGEGQDIAENVQTTSDNKAHPDQGQDNVVSTEKQKMNGDSKDNTDIVAIGDCHNTVGGDSIPEGQNVPTETRQPQSNKLETSTSPSKNEEFPLSELAPRINRDGTNISKGKDRNKQKDTRQHATKTIEKSKSEQTLQRSTTRAYDAESELKVKLKKNEINIDDLKKSLVRHDKIICQLKQDNNDLRHRLSKIAGERLTFDNPNIADLSDMNRPTKLGELYTELYDNEWTDAFEALKISGYTEREAITTLVRTLQSTVQFCERKADAVLCKANEAMNLMFEEYTQGRPLEKRFLRTFTSLADIKREQSVDNLNESGELWQIQRRWKPKAYTVTGTLKQQLKTISPVDVENRMKVLRKEISEAMVPIVQKAYMDATWDGDCLDGLLPYLNKCLYISWMMVVQSPPMCLQDTPDNPGAPLDTNCYRCYTISGKTIDFVVWPALRLHVDGPLSADVAQWLSYWTINTKVPDSILGPARNGHCGDLIEDAIQDHSSSTADSSGKAVGRLQLRPENPLVMVPRRFI